jgi:hypothetical protein
MPRIPWDETRGRDDDDDYTTTTTIKGQQQQQQQEEEENDDRDYQRALVAALEAKAMMEDRTLEKLARQEKGPLGFGILPKAPTMEQYQHFQFGHVGLWYFILLGGDDQESLSRLDDARPTKSTTTNAANLPYYYYQWQ